MNYERARHNMVEQQVRTWEVLDPTVLTVLGQIPREEFVPHRHRKLAYADVMLPLAYDEVMMKPVVEGRLLQGLDVQSSDEILEIGTGSGYLTACLAALGYSVLSIDQHEAFCNNAAEKLTSLGINNVSFETADVMSEWSPHKAYDVVAVTGSLFEVPERIKNWIAVGGRLFVIEGSSPAMEAKVITRIEDEQWRVESLFETDLPALTGAEAPEQFVL